MSASNRGISLPHLLALIAMGLAGAYCLYVAIVVGWSLL